jgi:hypothetical protein
MRDKRLILQNRHPLFWLEPGNRFIDGFGVRELGVGEGPFGRDIAVPPLLRAREAG